MDYSSDPNLWSWVEEPAVENTGAPSAEAVTVVVVAHNGHEWLLDALDGIDRLNSRPGMVIAVDTGSTDQTAQVLRRARAAGRLDRVVTGDNDWSFGKAVDAALADQPATEWLWLLHDDAVVRPDALDALLAQTPNWPRADVFTPTLLRPSRRHNAPRMSELGVSIAQNGRRELGLEPDEVGQGQHDPEMVLGGSTCGLLIRRSRYDSLGGFDPAVPIHRDGVEFGWRANLAGTQVVTCPTSHIVHRQVGRRGQRLDSLAAQAHRTEAGYDRFLGMRTVLAHQRGIFALLLLLRLQLGGFLRAVGFLIGKRPDGARDELLASWDLLRRGRGTRRLRRRIKAIGADRQTLQEIRALRPTWWTSVVRVTDSAGRAAAERFRSVSDPADVTLDDLTGDDFAVAGRTRMSSVLPAVLLVTGITAIVVAGRRLLATGPVTSTNLLTAPDSLSAAFGTYLLRPAGSEQSQAPWLGLAAVASVPAIRPTWAVVATLMLAVPIITAFTAWFLRQRVKTASVRWLASVGFAVSPALVGGLARGEVWLVIWAALLPCLGLAFDSWRPTRGRLEALRAPAGSALVLTLLTVLQPVVLLPAGVLILVAGFRQRFFVRPVIAVLVPLAVLAPWLPTLLRWPGRLITGPEPLLTDPGTITGWHVLLGRSAGAGLPPLWVSAAICGLLWLTAVIALALARHAWWQFVAAASVMAAALILSRVVVTVAEGQVRPDITGWLVAGLGLLVFTVAESLESGRRRLTGESFGVGQVLVVLGTITAALAVTGGLAWWVVGGLTGPLHRGPNTAIPPYVQAAENGPLQSRVLIIDLSSDQPAWLLHDSKGLRWGAGETGLTIANPAAQQELVGIVAQIAAARQDENLTARLDTLAVGHVQLRGASADALGTLAATPGITRGGDDGDRVIFNVTSKPSRLVLKTADATAAVGPELPAGSSGTLLLSQADDPRLQVQIGDVNAERAAQVDWRPAFQVTQGGQVTVQLSRDRYARATAAGQLGALLLLAVFAAPVIRRDYEDGARRSKEAD